MNVQPTHFPILVIYEKEQFSTLVETAWDIRSGIGFKPIKTNATLLDQHELDTDIEYLQVHQKIFIMGVLGAFSNSPNPYSDKSGSPKTGLPKEGMRGEWLTYNAGYTEGQKFLLDNPVPDELRKDQQGMFVNGLTLHFTKTNHTLHNPSIDAGILVGKHFDNYFVENHHLRIKL